MTGSPVFSINLTYLRIPTYPNYHMSIKKSQAILKHFIDLKFNVWFIRCAQKTKSRFVTLFSGRLPVKIVKTLKGRQSNLLAESIRSLQDKSGKGKEKRGEESGKRTAERRKRKEKRRKTKDEREKRKAQRGKTKEERGSSKCHKRWFRFLSPA